jgi:predicted O-methyltransferase YrrM
MSDACFNFHSFYQMVASRADFHSYVEIGVHTGASLSFLLLELQKRGGRFAVYGVDKWEDGAVFASFHARLLQNNLTTATQYLRKPSVEAALDFKDESQDFVFIDADHSYEAVKADIEAWYPKVRPGGMLAGHDYNEPSCGVTQAVCERFGPRVTAVGTVWHITK